MLKLNQLLNTAQLTGLAEVEARDLEISYYPTHRTQLGKLALKFLGGKIKTLQTEKFKTKIVFVCFFEIESHSAAPAGLEFIM